MKRMVTGLTALGLLACATGAAGAQEFHDWSGPYAGLQAGYESGLSKGSLGSTHGSSTLPYSFRPNGPIGGGHAGYNFQFGRIVLGAEGDAEGAGFSGRDPATGFGSVFTFKTTSDFDASLRLRGGVAFDRFLVYGTGGVAWGEVKTTYSCPVCNNAPAPFYTLSNMRIGWTAGVGAEYAVDRHWGVDFGYRYTDLHNKSYWNSLISAADRNSVTSHAIRLGISYHLPAVF